LRRSTIETAKGRWPGILHALGIDSDFLRDRHGPCPLCGGKDRFRFDDKDGEGSYFCSQCGAGKGLQLAMAWTGLPFQQCAARIDEIAGNVEPTRPKPQPDSSERLKRIGASLCRLDGTDPASMYLITRGLAGADTSHLRFHPGLAYYEDGKKQGTYPAMIAALTDRRGVIQSLHATYLRQGSSDKADVAAPKKILGKLGDSIAGCSIRLTDSAPTIGITEGIENALSVMKIYNIRCWSAYSANAMATFDPPEGVLSVAIFSDSDSNFVGQHAATTLAARLARSGYNVRIAPFLPVGKDFNDVVIEQQQEKTVTDIDHKSLPGFEDDSALDRLIETFDARVVQAESRESYVGNLTTRVQIGESEYLTLPTVRLTFASHKADLERARATMFASYLLTLGRETATELWKKAAPWEGKEFMDWVRIDVTWKRKTSA